MFVFGTPMLKCEGYSDKTDFFDNNDRKRVASNHSPAPVLPKLANRHPHQFQHG